MTEGSHLAPVPRGMPAIRVLVVADVRMYREGIAGALRAATGVEVVAALSRAPADLAGLHPDIVLHDVSRPHSLDTVRRLLSSVHDVKVIVIALDEHEPELLAYAEAGVSGYVTCEQSMRDVVDAVAAVGRGEMICTPRMAAVLVGHIATLAGARETGASSARSALTPREVEIVGLIDRGMSNKEIGRALHIEVATVKNHVHNVLEKLGVARRGEAVARLRVLRAMPAHAAGQARN